MYLKRLEIHGFKSFAHKMTLEFGKGIIAIVGPNGSGKSNVADALRWVLGEQSPKLIRGKKSEDVIFAGSDKKTRLGFAEVAATFDNEDHHIPLDASEVSIGRTVDRSGESEYLINGNKVRLLDVVDLLLKSNIGTSRYTVIGQGTIDQMILAGPTEIKNLIDEASGVKNYYLKREKTLRRLEQTANNLMRAEDLIAEIEPRLKSLRRQAKKMEAREEIETQLKHDQRHYYSYLLQDLEAQLQEVHKKIESLENQLTDLHKEISQISVSADEQEKVTKHQNAAFLKVKEDLEALQKNRLVLLEELAMVRGKIKAESGVSRKNIQIDIEGLKTKFQTAYQALLQLFNNFEQSRAAVVKSMFEEVSQIFTQAEFQQPEKILETLKQEESRLNMEIETLFDRIKTLEVDLKTYSKEEEEVKQRMLTKEHLLRDKQEARLKISETKNVLDVEQAKFSTRRDSILQEARAALGQDFVTPAEKVNISVPEVLEKITKLKKQLEMIGGIDDLTLKEYQETQSRYDNLSGQVADLKQGMADLRSIIEELDGHIKERFNQSFHKINEKFEYYFRILFNGGRAYLSVLKAEDKKPEELLEDSPEEEKQDELRPEEKLVQKYSRPASQIIGIDIKATPPGKKLASIQALSGGERSLTSIALLCSMLFCFPSPFVVLDEVDAALDDANTIRFGQILATLAHQTQFITITHNRETMAQSNTLYGVTMGDDGVSKLLSVKLDQAKAYAK